MSEPFAPDWKGDSVPCPYCRSTRTEFFSLFGQQLLTQQYYCNHCHTPFEYIKDVQMPDAGNPIQVAASRASLI